MFGLLGLVIGALLLIFGVFAVFFFPSSYYHQEEELTVGGVFLGIVSLLIGAALAFL